MLQYIINEKNEKKAVVIDFKEYKKLTKALEELEDALDIKIATELLNKDKERIHFNRQNYV